MKARPWFSIVLSIALLCSMFHAGFTAVYAAEESSYTSETLTINGKTTTWQLSGERPATFDDMESPARLEYYSSSALDFELKSMQADIPEGIYELTMELFSEQASPGPDALFYAITSEGTFSTPIAYSGSGWETPATINIGNIAVGSDGELVIGVKMVSTGEHYGYLRNIQLKEWEAAPEPAETATVKPNSSILRPDYTVQLTTNIGNDQSVSYESSDELVAVVDENGLVTAVGDGEAIISATVFEQEEAIAVGSSTIYVSSTLQSNAGPIMVEPVDELIDGERSEFIMGADISMLDALTEAGRKFYAEDGVESSLITELKDNGVNWIRLRSWVEPSDEQGNPYGAGNIDTDALVRMASQVKAADMKLLVDLHYSDFWTDPGRQSTPKAWASLQAAELEKQVYTYTYETLQALAEANAYPDMIQIGNEINGGMLWPLGNSPAKAKQYIAQGIQAVRDFEADVAGDHIDIVIHRANPADGLDRVSSFFGTYDDLDYDVIGLSYYPFWHGSLDNLQTVMDELAATYERKVAIVETSYAYTLEEPILNGPTGHIFGQAQEDTAGYLATVQGQASAIRDVIAAVAAVPEQQGIGIFYWEPGWQMGTDTGWATSHAASYQGEAIPADGGSGWANQALFNYFGEALPSLEVFTAVRASRDSYEEPLIVAVDDIGLTTSQDEYVELPMVVKALFSDDTYRNTEVVSWSPESYDYKVPGQYVLTGTLQGGQSIEATITVRPKNYIVNAGLESEDMSAWELVNSSRSTDAAYSGSYAIHFWDQESLSAKQRFTNLPEGVYQLSVQTRIGVDDQPIADTSMLYAAAGEEIYATPLEVTGWDQWKEITVSNIVVKDGKLEIGVIVNDAANDYGDFDDWELLRISGPEPSPSPTPTKKPSTGAVEAPTLSAVTRDDKTVLTAKLSDTVTELKLPLHELDSSEDADVVIDWGNSTITITREELKQALGELSIQALTVKKVTAEVKDWATDANIKVLKTAGWHIFAETADGSKELYLPLQWTEKLKADISPASVALFRTNNDNELIYEQGVSDDYTLKAPIQLGQSYVVAAVTRSYVDSVEQSDAVRKLTAMGIVQGNQQSALNLHQAATRAEVSKLVALLVALQGESIAVQQANGEPKQFTDVPESHWAKSYIDLLTHQQWLLGVGEDSFEPNEAMSHESLYVLLARMLKLSTVASEDDELPTIAAHSWAIDSIRALQQAGLLPEQLGGIDFTAAISREEMFERFYQLILYLEN